MKNKIVFRKNLLTVTLILTVMAILEEAFFAYYTFKLADEDKRFVFVIVMCLIVLAVVGIYWILFRQYLIVNDETVTLCKLFNRVQTIDWKDASLSTSVNSAAQTTVTITDGTHSITFPSISDKSLAQFKQLCKNAREKYDTDNLTF